MIRNCNDGTQNTPYLRCDLNIWNVDDLPDFSVGPKGDPLEKYHAIKSTGYVGVQDGDPELCTKAGLRLTGQFRMNRQGDLNEKMQEWTNGPYDCASIHVGWGIESDAEVDHLIGEVIELSFKYDFPVYVETHRATVTQDMWRTVEIVKRFPEIRFNGDFSHWYTGLEMVNGGMESKLTFMQPVFDRVRFMHGRIGNPGCIQVSIDGNEPFVDDFRSMWILAFRGFLKSAQPGDYLCFTPELLPSTYYYAQLRSGQEVSDRWEQALLLCKIARECLEVAKVST